MTIMKKTVFIICVLLLAGSFSVISFASAKPDKAKPPLEKRVYIHYKEGHGKPDWVTDKKPPKEDDHSKHYDLLGKGVVWWAEDLALSVSVNPTNGYGLEYTFVLGAVTASGEEWDSWTSTELFDDLGYSIDLTADFDYDSPDGSNEIVFGDYAEADVIAVCFTWGYFSGPPSSRRIVEFDIMLDTDFDWGDGELDPALMDVQNIVTHEMGHGIGLADIYDCELETMYGYSYEGDIEKRTLYDGDIAGLQKLYGE